MSLDQPNNLTESCDQPVCDAVAVKITPQQQDLGGFFVRRALPHAKQRQVGPWVFFDHMGPAQFPAGEGINVRPHPHINLATVTYLFEGEIFHRDSLGNAAPISPGDINLMVAGRGIVHSERQRDEIRNSDNNRLHGLQLWLALPEADEETDADFIHYASADIPSVEIDGVPVKVMIGEAFGVSSPVKTFADTLYFEAALKAGQSLRLPNDVDERAVYVADGQVSVGSTALDAYDMGVLKPVDGVALVAITDCRIALIGGEQLQRRHIYWNFVSSRKERIEEAKDDWVNGRFPKVPGDEEEFIPLPDLKS